MEASRTSGFTSANFALMVQPAEHRQLGHFREEFGHEDHEQADGDEDEGEGYDIQRRFRNIHIGLQPGADQGGEPESRPDAQDDAREGQGLFEETL